MPGEHDLARMLASLDVPRLDPAPTHAEIASRVSTHREAVTRELNRLSKVGLITREGAALIVHDLDSLAAMLHQMTGE